MFQWLQVLEVLAEDPSLVPGIHSGCLKLPLTSAVWYYMPFYGFCGTHKHVNKNQSINQ